MANLFDLTADYLQILDMMDDPELDQQTLADTMEGIEGALEDKFDRYVYVAKQEQGDIDVLNETIKQLQARKKSKEENLKKLKKVMTDVMNGTGKIKFKTAQHSYWVQKNPKSVVIDTENVRDIPEDYLTFKEPEANKTAIQKAIEEGKDFSGLAHIEQTEGVRWR
jgi:hypothetical protein